MSKRSFTGIRIFTATFTANPKRRKMSIQTLIENGQDEHVANWKAVARAEIEHDRLTCTESAVNTFLKTLDFEKLKRTMITIKEREQAVLKHQEEIEANSWR
jgi:hypothetical protein